MKITQQMMIDWHATIDVLLRTPKKEVVVEFADKDVKMRRKVVILHLHSWWILLKHNHPVTSFFVMSQEEIDAGLTNMTICRLHTKIYQALLETTKSRDSQYDFWESMNCINNFILRECGEYHKSISIIQLVELMDQEPMKKINDGITFDKDTSTDVVEVMMTEATQQMVSALYDPMDGKNVLLEYHKLGLINKDQLTQIILAIGTRTDVNDTMIRYPIRASFLGGLQNIHDYMVESLSAKKAAFYNKMAIPNSQYFARMLHLLTSSLTTIYPGDCGTQLTIPFYVHEDNYKNLIGKHYVEKGNLLTVTEENCKSLIGHTIEMRSPLACRHTDGVCEVCGGQLTDYVVEGIKIGISSAIEVSSSITQKILSSKHLQNTVSVMYMPPDVMSHLFVAKKDRVYWRQRHAEELKGWKIGVQINDMQHISDLKIIKTKSSINEEHFSKITQLMISAMEGDKPVVGVADMGNGKRYPYFSREMLMYIKEHYDEMEIGDIVWIPMDKFDISQPIFKSMVVNDSMLEFVDTAKGFLEHKIQKYTSAIETLKDFSDIIYDKVSTNMFHLEVMLKAYLITDEYDLSIPVVDDPDNVRFGNTKYINAERSLGNWLAFERLFALLKHPRTYTIPRTEGAFDVYMGFNNKMT